jgi:HAD superfamily hydrolase (TIGR01509 family)
VAEKYHIDIDIEKDKARTYLIYEELVRGKLKALPGVFETLDLCRKHHLRTAVATSADEIKMRINLKEIGLSADRFDAAVFGEMVRNKKPDPEIFLRAAGLLGVKPEECLVIEDAPSGLMAANAAGMKSLAVCTSFAPRELRMADWILPDLASFSGEHLNW